MIAAEKINRVKELAGHTTPVVPAWHVPCHAVGDEKTLMRQVFSDNRKVWKQSGASESGEIFQGFQPRYCGAAALASSARSWMPRCAARYVSRIAAVTSAKRVRLAGVSRTPFRLASICTPQIDQIDGPR